MVARAVSVAETLGELMARRRAVLGMSQQALADAIGTSRSYVSQIESGNRQWPVSLVGKIATALQVSVDDLYAAHAEARWRRDAAGELSYLPVGEAPLSGHRARLAEAVRDLSEEEAESVLKVVDLLTRKGRGTAGGTTGGASSLGAG